MAPRGGTRVAPATSSELQLLLEIRKLESTLSASIHSKIPILIPHKFVPSKFVENVTSPLNQRISSGASRMKVLRMANLRRSSIFLGVCNLVLVLVGGLMVGLVLKGCDRNRILVPLFLVSSAAGFKVFGMVLTGLAQEATARSIVDSPPDHDHDADHQASVVRLKRRVSYTTWLWWSRVAIVITMLQLGSALFLLFNVMEYITHHHPTSQCHLGIASTSSAATWQQKLLIAYIVMASCVPMVHCFAGPDVLRWRAFYEAQDEVWEAHYKEVFDYGIREALCCLGRFKYLTIYEEDEVHSVAKLLGNLVAYRASGTGHLELLAGLALLQKNYEPPKCEDQTEAPMKYIEDAFTLHEFTEAAYTGPLLDFGRNAIFFPCTWLYRQGIFTPWTRNSRPVLDGDNWWRGHAAAFLNYVKLPPQALRRGRVCQEKCEAAYFIVVLHSKTTVVVAVRGTETPEDLITDGLGKACPLSRADLDGLLNNNYIPLETRQKVELSFPHYAHLGIVEAARDLYNQIEGKPVENMKSQSSTGFLSSLLGVGCECEGYTLRIVGHSLGGAIASMLGLRLKHKFPNLHVYAYGPLPCVDSLIAEACSDFITSIVHENEFSTRLSVGSIMRLRADAIMALSQDSEADSTLIFRLARRFISMNKCQKRLMDRMKHDPSTNSNPQQRQHSKQDSTIAEGEDQEEANDHDQGRRQENQARHEDSESAIWDLSNADSSHETFQEEDDGDDIIFGDDPLCEITTTDTFDDTISQLLATTPILENDSSSTGTSCQDVFLPGRIIHLVSQQFRNDGKLWNILQRTPDHEYRAYLGSRDQFRDIVVSPYMFIDHLPWRCHHALKMILEAKRGEDTTTLPDV